MLALQRIFCFFCCDAMGDVSAMYRGAGRRLGIGRTIRVSWFCSRQRLVYWRVEAVLPEAAGANPGVLAGAAGDLG